MESEKEHEIKNVAKFFAGRSIFITGGTGFLGKILIEKFLRSCPDLEALYILMRPKKNISIDERLKKVFALPVSARKLDCKGIHMRID